MMAKIARRIPARAAMTGYHMNETDRDAIAYNQPPFAGLMGLSIISSSVDEIVGTMKSTEQLSNRNGVMHGGAIMAFADNLGGTAASVCLDAGMATTTIESKTNFLRPIRIGDTAHGRCIALHKGRTTAIWQTTITRDDGKVAAIVTQTQIILKWQDHSG